jgi:hypothetical protein
LALDIYIETVGGRVARMGLGTNSLIDRKVKTESGIDTDPIGIKKGASRNSYKGVDLEIQKSLSLLNDTFGNGPFEKGALGIILFVREGDIVSRFLGFQCFHVLSTQAHPIVSSVPL